MLVLSRKLHEKIVIGDNINITVVRIAGNKVRLGIEAPPNIVIRREELPITGEDTDGKKQDTARA